jgi:hypothetical protein
LAVLRREPVVGVIQQVWRKSLLNQTSLSEYIEQALVEAMRFDIEEGNFCDALLEKIGVEATQ